MENHTNTPNFRRKEMLLVSKGGYSWTKDDFSHALQAMMKDQKENNSTRLVLCSLLSNPGIGLPRSGKKRKRSHVGCDEHDSLLPHVIEHYFKRNRGRNKICASGMRDLVHDVNKIASLRINCAFNRNNSDMHGEHCYEQVNNEILSDAKCDMERDIMLYFLDPQTLVKVSYAAQLYDRYVKLYCTCSNSKDGNNQMGKSKHLSFLKKLTKMSHIDMQILQVFILMLLEPMRREIRVPMDEYKNTYWLKFMLRQPDGISSIQLSESFDILRDTVVDCISSLSDKAEHPNICKVDTPILILACRSSFPIAKVCIGKFIRIAVGSLESIPSRVMENVLDPATGSKKCDNNLLVTEEHSGSVERVNVPPVSIDFDNCVIQLKQLVLSDSRLKSLFLTLLKVCDEGIHIQTIENDLRNFRQKSLIKIRDVVLQ